MNFEYICVAYFSLGLFVGLAAGVLGIGGGILVVPGLTWLFESQHFPNNLILHFAIGTSFAIMLITSSRGILSHLKYKLPIWEAFHPYLIGLVAGVVGGGIVTHHLHSHVISIIFGCFVVIIGCYMLIGFELKPLYYRLSHRKLVIFG